MAAQDAGLSSNQLESSLAALFELSESRGKEAAGLAIHSGDAIHVLKQPVPATTMIRSAVYRAFLDAAIRPHIRAGQLATRIAAIGHSRLVTNGLQIVAANNQPVAKDGVVAVHNGIVVNDAALWTKHARMRRQADVDTEVIVSLARMYLDDGLDLASAVSRVFAELEGAASIAALAEDQNHLTLATNTGSLYVLARPDGRVVVFSSERFILRQFVQRLPDVAGASESAIEHVHAGRAVLVDLESAAIQRFAIVAPELAAGTGVQRCEQRAVMTVHSRSPDEEPSAMVRCASCVLPSTVPGADLDAAGVCAFCRSHRPAAPATPAALELLLEAHRSHDGAPDCIVTLSGGRDSSYVLHVLKREYGMHPIALTYDGGAMTEVARRNQARVCGKLGVEHSVISGNVKAKRSHIARRIIAWLRRPVLGLVPLFTLGDAPYALCAERFAMQSGIKLVVHGDNPLEVAPFKLALAGTSASERQLIAFAARELVLNPRHVNRALPDALRGLYSQRVAARTGTSLFDHLQWDEARVVSTLIDSYGWESIGEPLSTWRVDDSSAAFRDFIYVTLAGFGEFDVLRSNQVRAGQLNRERALELVESEAQPRFGLIREFAHEVGFDCDDVLHAISSAPRQRASRHVPLLATGAGA